MGFVYILTNPSMPGWIKIGSTENISNRLKSLNERTAVPLSFSCYASLETADYEVIEHNIHSMIDNINPELRAKERTHDDKMRVREFFRMSPQQATQVLKNIMELKGIPENKLVYDQATEDEIEEEKKRRERTTFLMLGIPKGTELTYERDANIKVITDNDINMVIYKDEPRTISNVAAELLGEHRNGFEHFMYKGRTLWDIRCELEEKESEKED